MNRRLLAHPRLRVVVFQWIRTLVFIFVGTSQAETLTFDKALAIALRESPTLRASAEQIEAARNSVIPADALPDPTLSLGVENLPITGDDRLRLDREAMTMRRVGIMQAFPNGAKRNARAATARARVARAEAAARVTQAMVLRETAMAWIARAGVERQLTRIDALSGENRVFDAAVRARLVSGQATATEAVMPRREAALIDERRDELQARQAQANAALRRWIGAAADATLDGHSPTFDADPQKLTRQLHRHPEILSLTPQAELLNAEIEESRSTKRPDWALELGYQYRAAPFDDMVSMQVRIDLPIFPGSRQNPNIAAKLAERGALEAEIDALIREHAAQLESDLAELRRLSNAEKRQREVLLPLAEEKVALSLAAWRSGKGGLSEMIVARAERIDSELRVVELETQRLQLAARLHFSYYDHTIKVDVP